MNPVKYLATRLRQSTTHVVMAKFPFLIALEASQSIGSPLVEAHWSNRSYQASATATSTLWLGTQPGRDCLSPACDRCC